MSVIDSPLDLIQLPAAVSAVPGMRVRRRPVVLVLEDSPVLSAALGELCAFLRVGVERVRRGSDLARVLRRALPRIGELAEFVCLAGRERGCLGLMAA